jgi:hypothetical protein
MVRSVPGAAPTRSERLHLRRLSPTSGLLGGPGDSTREQRQLARIAVHAMDLDAAMPTAMPPIDTLAFRKSRLGRHMEPPDHSPSAVRPG